MKDNNEMDNQEMEQLDQITKRGNPLVFNRKQAIVGGLAILGASVAGFVGGMYYQKHRAAKATSAPASPILEKPEELL